METILNKKIIRNFLIGLSVFFSLVSILWIQQPSNKATLLWKNGCKEKAISVWTNEIKKKNDLNSYQKLIEALISCGRYEEAEKISECALTYYPHCANFLFYLAVINFYKGNLNASLNLTEKVVAINEFFPEVYLLRGMIFENMNCLQQAKKEFIKEINNNPANRLAWAKLKEPRYANI